MTRTIIKNIEDLADYIVLNKLNTSQVNKLLSLAEYYSIFVNDHTSTELSHLLKVFYYKWENTDMKPLFIDID